MSKKSINNEFSSLFVWFYYDYPETPETLIWSPICIHQIVTNNWKQLKNKKFFLYHEDQTKQVAWEKEWVKLVWNEEEYHGCLI